MATGYMDASEAAYDVDTSGLSDKTLRTINEHYKRHC